MSLMSRWMGILAIAFSFLTPDAHAVREVLVPGLNVEARFDWEHYWDENIHPWLCRGGAKKIYTCPDGADPHNDTKCENAPSTLPGNIMGLPPSDKCTVIPPANRRIGGGVTVYLDLINISDVAQPGTITIMDVDNLGEFRSRISSTTSVSNNLGALVSRRMATGLGICPSTLGSGNDKKVFTLPFNDGRPNNTPITQSELTANFNIPGRQTNRIRIEVMFTGVYGDALRSQSDYGSGVANSETIERYRTTYTRVAIPMIKIKVDQDRGAISGVISSTQIYGSGGSSCIGGSFEGPTNTFMTPTYLQEKGIGQIIQINGGRPF